MQRKRDYGAKVDSFLVLTRTGPSPLSSGEGRVAMYVSLPQPPPLLAPRSIRRLPQKQLIPGSIIYAAFTALWSFLS